MTIPATIDLLRHGDTGQRGFRGQLDDPLTEIGWAQMRAAVAGRAWDRIVSSPLQRCAMFARALADQQGCPLCMDARLAEYHFGDWQGLAMDVLAAEQGEALACFWADPVAYPPPGAESMGAFRERLCAVLDDIARESVGLRVLVVTHGGVIRMLRCVVEQRDFGEMANLQVPHAALHTLRWSATVPA